MKWNILHITNNMGVFNRDFCKQFSKKEIPLAKTLFREIANKIVTNTWNTIYKIKAGAAYITHSEDGQFAWLHIKRGTYKVEKEEVGSISNTSSLLGGYSMKCGKCNGHAYDNDDGRKICSSCECPTYDCDCEKLPKEKPTKLRVVVEVDIECVRAIIKQFKTEVEHDGEMMKTMTTKQYAMNLVQDLVDCKFDINDSDSWLNADKYIDKK